MVKSLASKFSLTGLGEGRKRTKLSFKEKGAPVIGELCGMVVNS